MAKKINKKRKALLEKIEKDKKYSVNEATELLPELKSAKFDETVEVALNLNVDPRHADQMIRGSVILPNGTGKTVRVAVFAKDDKADEAKEAGADIVGSDELIAQIQEGNINFDTVNFSTFCFCNCFCHIHSYSSSFWVRHKTFWS